MVNTAFTILLLPLLAFLIVVFVTWRQKVASAWVTIVGMGITMLLALLVILPQTMAGATDHAEINWLRLLPSGAPAGATS